MFIDFGRLVLTRLNRQFTGCNLTVYSGVPPAEPALLGLSSLEQAVVYVPDELVQLRMRRVHYIRPGFTQDPSGDPPLRGQGHHQESHRADTEHRGHRERYPFPQRRHLTSPWCPEEGNTTPGCDREAHSAITMSLIYSLEKEKIIIIGEIVRLFLLVNCCMCVSQRRRNRIYSLAVKEISHRGETLSLLYPCSIPALSLSLFRPGIN